MFYFYILNVKIKKYKLSNKKENKNINIKDSSFVMLTHTR